MKPSSTRLKMIAGAVGVLSVSSPVMISAQGVPLGQAGTPVGENAVPVGENASPVGEDASPVGENAMPIGEGAVPLADVGMPVGEGAVPVGENAVPAGQNGIPVGEDATPTGKNGIPVGEDATPTGKNGIPVGEDATPDGQNGIPVGEGATPLAESGIPVGEYATPTDESRQLRIKNRTTAMSNPQTARFFAGDARTRVGNVSGNLATATAAPSTVTDASLSQRDADDRDWSRAALASAESRPKDLFSSDWWAAHPNVLEGAGKYYTEKSANAWYQGSPWSELIRVLGMGNDVQPFKYSNDLNITFKNDVIYVNGLAVSSYDDFVYSARELAQPLPQEEGKRQGWFPLGTFAVSANSKTKTSTHAIQLAMDSLGNIAGVCVNWPEGTVLPIHGRVNTNSQRVAFTIGKSAVAETGLSNLTNPYTRVWAHLANSHSQTWLITRIRAEGE